MDKKREKKTIADTVCRVHRSGGYAVLSNCFVRSIRIGCDSIALLGKIMDLPPTWNFTIAGLVAICKDDDAYRQTVNRVQLAMATGSMSLQQAIDTAVGDFLDQGINCIVYKDGKRVNIADYVRMVLRNTATRAALQGKSAKYKALGYDTVVTSSYDMCSETCKPWQGRIYIDDTFTRWSGETRMQGDMLWGKSGYCGKWFPLLSEAIKRGLFHPNCRHSINLWRDGDPLPESIDNSDNERRYKLEQQQRALERAVRKAKRRAEGFTDPANIKKAKAEVQEAQKALREFINKVNADEGETVLRRDYGKETSYGAAELTDKEKDDIIKYEECQKKLREMISNGDISLELNPEMQNRHYKGTKEYDSFLARGIEKSYFNVPVSELQDFVYKNVSYGKLFFTSQGSVREVFFFKENAAFDTRLNRNTAYITVHYSKNRTHVVPYSPRKKKR